MRWWDGSEWTDEIRPVATQEDEETEDAEIPTNPAQTSSRSPGLASLFAGMLFGIASVLAAFQTLYMTGIFTIRDYMSPTPRIPVSLPFDWYLILFRYWARQESFFAWSMVPPMVVLAGCAICAFLFGRRLPKVAIASIAVLLTIQNLFLLIPIFIDSGVPGVTIFMPSVYAAAGLTPMLVGIMLTRFVVMAIPILFAGLLFRSDLARRRLAITFLVTAVVYFMWYIIIFLPGSAVTHSLLTPASPNLLGAWIAPASTLICLIAMSIFTLPALRRDKRAKGPVRFGTPKVM